MKKEETETAAALDRDEAGGVAEPSDSAGIAGAAQRIQDLEAALAEQREARLRAAAEAENINRRAQKQVSEAYGRGQRQIARELLAAIDSLELGLDALDAASAADLAEGQRAVLRQLLKALGQFGVEAVEPQGQPFDPERHEAVGMQPSDAVEPQSVLSVMQKGYLMQGRLLRAARVVVCSGPPGSSPDAEEPASGEASGESA